MSTISSNPWQTPPDDSYWRRLLQEAEHNAPTDSHSTAEYGAEVDYDPALSSPNSAGSGQKYEASPAPLTQGQQSSNQALVEPNASLTGLDADWQKAEALLQNKSRIDLKVVGYNRGGLLVRFGEIQGFVPASQLEELPKDLNSHLRQAELARRVGELLCLQVIELDRQRNRLIFSERANVGGVEAEQFLNNLKPGDILKARVVSLCGFGAFVDLGGVEGFIHISEFSWGRVNHPSDMLTVGQETDVYVLSIEPTQSRVSLSLKRLKPDPWTMIDEKYEVGHLVDGEVTNVVSFGAFVRVEEGMEGLVHISELAEGNFLHPRNVVQEGDTVTARIIRIDSTNHRLGLSLRQAADTGVI